MSLEFLAIALATIIVTSYFSESLKVEINKNYRNSQKLNGIAPFKKVSRKAIKSVFEMKYLLSK